MRNLLRYLAFVLMIGGAFAQTNLPFCSGSDFAKWNNCFGVWETPYSKYEGEFSDGQRHGRGTLTYPNGDTYIGEFKNGKLNGQVIASYANGDKYIGEFKNNKFHGKGTHTFASGNVYVGDFKEGARSGQGTFIFGDGGKYEGGFLGDSYNGRGTYTYPNGDKYIGEHRSGKFNGQGIATYINGNKYIGEFKDDKLNGEGILFAPNGSIINQGIWVENKFSQPKQIQRIDSTNLEIEKLRAEVAEAKKKQEQLELTLQLSQQNAELTNQKIEASDVDKRIALVVGNSSYKFSQLDSPINDARMIAAALKALKFDVTLIEDAGIKSLKDHVDKFTQSLNDTRATGLFYFAGHGVQNNGKNYLLPVDAIVRSAGELESSSFDIQIMLDSFRIAKNGMNILILDACRNNPFSKTGSASGLAAVDGPPGTIVAFSTAPGKVAQENFDNGVYTKRLLENIKLPGASIEDIFKKVRLDVIADTNGEQIPWENTALIRDFYFSGIQYGKKPKVAVDGGQADDFDKISKNNIYDWINFYRKNKGTSFDPKVLVGVNSILSKLTYPAPPLLIEELPYLLNDGYAGFDVAVINSYAADFFKFPKKSGLQVATIYADSAAEKAGLHSGDIIFSINDIEIETLSDLASLQPKLVPGEYIEGVVWRGGRKISLRGVLERAPIERLLSVIAFQNFSKRNFQRAKIYAEYLSNINDSRGQLLNGVLFAQGLGVDKDLKIAERELTKSARQSPIAAAQLAILYMSPSSGLVNDAQAFKLARFAADAGRSDGASALALAYFKGIGTSKNDVESVRWSRLSAEMGSGYGMFLLGARYEDGAGGLEKNIDLAKLWYRRSRDLNFAPARSALQRFGE